MAAAISLEHFAGVGDLQLLYRCDGVRTVDCHRDVATELEMTIGLSHAFVAEYEVWEVEEIVKGITVLTPNVMRFDNPHLTVSLPTDQTLTFTFSALEFLEKGKGVAVRFRAPLPETVKTFLNLKIKKLEQISEDWGNLVQDYQIQYQGKTIRWGNTDKSILANTNRVGSY